MLFCHIYPRIFYLFIYFILPALQYFRVLSLFFQFGRVEQAKKRHLTSKYPIEILSPQTTLHLLTQHTHQWCLVAETKIMNWN